MKPTGNLVADIICYIAKIGLMTIGAADAGTTTIINAAPVAVSNICPECGHPRKLRDHTLRRLVDLPVVGFPSRPDARVSRFLCTATSYPRKILQTSPACTDDRSKSTHHIIHQILQRLATDRISVSAIVKALGIGWNLANQVAFDACCQFVYDDPHHLDGMCILDVGEHIWKHTREPGQPSNLVTTLVDLTPLADEHGPARLLGLRPGRNAEVLHTRLQERNPSFRSQAQVVTMDGSTGYVPAANQVLPNATKAMDPFHAVYLAADELTGCQQRLQRGITERHGCKDDPLYKYRRTLLARTSCPTQRQKQQLDLL